MTNEKIEFQQSRDFGGIINATFAFLKQNFKDIALGVLIFCSPFILIAGIIFTITPRFFSIGGPVGFNPSAFFFYALIVSVVFLVYYTGLSSILYSYVLLYTEKGHKNFNLQTLWQSAISRVWNIFVSVFTFVIVFLLTYLASIIVSMLLMFILAPLLGFFAGLIIFFVILIPMIFIFIALSFLVIIRLNERIGVISAISRCFNLLKGNNDNIWRNWFRSFGLLLVTFLITSVLAYLVQIPFLLILFSGESITSQNPLNQSFLYMFIYTTIYLLATSLLQSINITALSFLYFSLKEEQEMQSLAGRIDTLGENF